ncbi:Sulfotransferase family protein [Balamuthia mandrillaris]
MPLSASANTIFVFLLGLTFGLTIGIFSGTAHQNALAPTSSEGQQRLLEFQWTGPTELRRKVSIVTELQNYLDEFRGRPSLPFPLPSLPSPYYPFSAPVTLSTRAVPKVFGLGLSKTGTTSLKEALRLLGIDCYKDTNLMNDILQQSFADEPDEPYSVDIVRRYDDKTSVTDLPLPYFFEEVAHLYPDAKFILTVREPASWWLSFKAHMERNDKSRTSQVRNTLRALHYGGERPSQYVAVKAFLRHNKLVQALIPPERLLVLDIMTESDETLFRRLCEFVGVAAKECPSDQEFPHANKIPSFQLGKKKHGQKSNGAETHPPFSM